MDNATQLRNIGIELTDSRKKIFDLLLNSQTPLSTTAIIRLLKNNTIHRATVFRTMRTFLEKGLLKSIDFQEGELRYVLSSLAHHHYAFCRTCGKTEIVVDCIAKKVARIMKSKYGFQTIDHSFVLFGICNACAALV